MSERTDDNKRMDDAVDEANAREYARMAPAPSALPDLAERCKAQETRIKELTDYGAWELLNIVDGRVDALAAENEALKRALRDADDSSTHFKVAYERVHAENEALRAASNTILDRFKPPRYAPDSDPLLGGGLVQVKRSDLASLRRAAQALKGDGL